jgi:predicted enzyme related to lactoylglutathione lyase
MLKHYDNFFLPAADLARGREFYQGILGLPVKFDFSSHGLLAFNVGEEEPAIILRSHPNTKPSILFEVEDVKIAYQELKEKGVVFLSEPYEINTGLAVELEDPFGNRLGITDYSKRPELSNILKDKNLPG